MCDKPIDLNRDDTADEDGKVMHAQCYLKRVGEELLPRRADES